MECFFLLVPLLGVGAYETDVREYCPLRDPYFDDGGNALNLEIYFTRQDRLFLLSPINLTPIFSSADNFIYIS